jgi:hypothetical protein
MPPSSARFDTNKAVFVARLLKTWEKLPELSFVDLVRKAMMGDHGPIADADIILRLERLALLSDPAKKAPDSAR